MYRLLLVDNEEIIVEGMALLLESEPSLDLEIYKAHSAEEALNWMKRTKMDIALLDIRMPGMNGLELQKAINSQWPRCKVLFLTGYSDFAYAQEALRHGSLDYLLKTDGDERIIESLRRVVGMIENEMKMERIIVRAREHMQKAVPALQKEFVQQLLQASPLVLHRLDRQLNELNIPLIADETVLLFIGDVSQWKEEHNHFDRSLLMYAVQNITEELLNISARVLCMQYNRTRLVTFVQPTEQLSWSQTIRFVHGTLEQLQDTCQSLLQLAVSFASASKAVSWSEIPQQYEALSLMLSRGLLTDHQQLLIQGQGHGANEESTLRSDEFEHTIRVMLHRIQGLKELLDLGMEQKFFSEYDNLMDEFSMEGEQIEDYRLEVTYSLISMMVSYVNRWKVQKRVSEYVDLRQLRDVSQFETWAQCIQYFRKLAKLLFSLKEEGDLEQSEKTIAALHHYIHHHLHEELSLTRLGEEVGYNPSYLSRYYKQVTGMGLSEYIQEQRIKRAKEMLHEGWAIKEISVALGFISEPYFYRFFKKQIGMTPQEYREQVNKR